MTAPLRYVRVPFFLLAAALTGACGGNSVLSSGSGGDGLTGGGGSGGSTSSASGGGGAGTGGATGGTGGCPAACVSPEVCDEGACKVAMELQIHAFDLVVLDPNGPPSHLGQLRACAFSPDPTKTPQILGEEGGCVAYAHSYGSPSVPFEAGTLTVESPNAGLTTLVDAPGDCVEAKLAGGNDLAPGEGFLPGETATFSITGGAMFPESQLQAILPEPMDLQQNPVWTPGEAHVVQWTGPTPQKVFAEETANDGYIECTPVPGGTLTIPGSLTQFFNQQMRVSIVTADEAVIDVSPSRTITARALRGELYWAP